MNIDHFVRSNNLLPADGVLVKKKFLGLLRHYVIYLGKYEGRHRFIANMTGGLKVLSEGHLYEYLEYLIPKQILRFQGSQVERRNAVHRAYHYDKRAYNLLANNCEHYFNYVHHGKARSAQTQIFGAGLAVGGIVMTANNLAKEDYEDENKDLKAAAGILLTGLGLLTIGLGSK